MKNKVVRGLAITGIACMMLTACGNETTTDNVEITDTTVSQEVSTDPVTEITEESTPMAEAVMLTAEDFVVSILDDGTVMLTQYSGDAENVEIPSEVNGKTVTVIGEDAFMNHDELKSVIIPDTVVEIRDNAFLNCFNLTEATMSQNIERIGADVFSSLCEIELPDTLKELGNSAFASCDFTSIVIPTSLEEIGVYSFGYTSLEELVVPGNIKIIKEEAFDLCQQLKNVVIEEGVEVIEEHAFSECDVLESVTIPASVTEMTDPFWRSENVTIYTPAGSYAETWAVENGVPCVTQ